MSNEIKLMQRFIRASQGLAYWSKELLKSNEALQKQLKPDKEKPQIQTTGRESMKCTV